MSNSPFLSNCTADTIREASAALKAGHLVAFPTETVYGLGADARNPDAVKRIYEVKGRPTDHPLIVHISSINQIEKWASEIPDYAISLARVFWPGPMTLILKRSEIAGDFITGGQDTLGLRVPSNPIALALIQEFEKISDSAIAAPSANRFGQVSPTSMKDVEEELGLYLSTYDKILDGGNSNIGIESTIIDCTRDYPKVLRHGFVTPEDLSGVVVLKDESSSDVNQVKFSGSFSSHYAPKCSVFLGGNPKPGEGFLALSDVDTPNGVHRISTPTNVYEFMRVLYTSFRRADHLGLPAIWVQIPSESGLWLAVLDRISKASCGNSNV
jgi:L-threonylcarbamoyladenylate synthase